MAKLVAVRFGVRGMKDMCFRLAKACPEVGTGMNRSDAM